MKNRIKKFLNLSLTVPLFILFQFPASTNYQLKGYEFGAGGGSSDSTNYSIEGVVGEAAGKQDSTNFSVLGGLNFAQNANVPAAPTFVNSSSWYNKLLLTINTSNNPTDTTYAIAISDDNWTTTKYVQNDNTIGSTLGTEDYQTYTNWGGASGEYVVGLTGNTTYKVKLKATSGQFTETGYGPEASAATSALTLSFDIDVSSTDTETAAPYSVSMGDLTAGSVITASDKVWIDIATNAEYGGSVYVYDSNAGLRSSATAYTISSASTNITSASEGFGLRVDSASNVSSVSPYDGASDNVGIVNTTIRSIFTSATPITTGRGSILVKAKASSVTPAAADYTDTLTLIASGTF